MTMMMSGFSAGRRVSYHSARDFLQRVMSVSSRAAHIRPGCHGQPERVSAENVKCFSRASFTKVGISISALLSPISTMCCDVEFFEVSTYNVHLVGSLAVQG